MESRQDYYCTASKSLESCLTERSLLFHDAIDHSTARICPLKERSPERGLSHLLNPQE